MVGADLLHQRLRECDSRDPQALLDGVAWKRKPKEASKSSRLPKSCVVAVNSHPNAAGVIGVAEVRLQTKFSSIFTLEKGKVFTADNPILMYERKTFALSYKEQHGFPTNFPRTALLLLLAARSWTSMWSKSICGEFPVGPSTNILD